MQENNNKESNESEYNDRELNKAVRFSLLPENPSVSATEVQGTIYAPPDDACRYPVEKWFKELDREMDEPTDEKVGVYIADDTLTVEVADGGLGISVPLSMIEELIAVYRDENRARIRVTS